MREAVRAGVAVFNSGFYHGAHDVWEEVWLDAEGGDAALLQGLIQYAGAVHHARERNWEGCVGLAGSAVGYLAAADPHGVNVAAVREYLAALETDPERVERGPPQGLTVDGEVLTLPDLGPDEALAAAPVLAAELGDESVERGVEYALADVERDEEGSEFVRFAIDFVTNTDRRAVVAQRLGQHAERRLQRERDVEGLF